MAGRRDRGVGVGRSRAGSRPGAAAVVACVVAALCAGAAAVGAGRAAGVAAPTPVADGAAALGPLAAAVALQPAPAGWLRACRALVTRPACPALVQRTPLWADAEAVQLRRVNRSYGATSTILYADRRYLGELPVCAQLFDGVTHDYSRIVPTCYARFARHDERRGRVVAFEAAVDEEIGLGPSRPGWQGEDRPDDQTESAARP